mmetsp:Transcript_4020/g.13767  ORF Transcript_4020/g.13767 Transcript_4020/m.13767 type:complete len:216 (-) Transcript_4020:356-1003(-)
MSPEPSPSSSVMMAWSSSLSLTGMHSSLSRPSSSPTSMAPLLSASKTLNVAWTCCRSLSAASTPAMFTAARFFRSSMRFSRCASRNCTSASLESTLASSAAGFLPATSSTPAPARDSRLTTASAASRVNELLIVHGTRSAASVACFRLKRVTARSSWMMRLRFFSGTSVSDTSKNFSSNISAVGASSARRPLRRSFSRALFWAFFFEASFFSRCL